MADVVLFNAHVLTPAAVPGASTIVVRDGRILAVGDDRSADTAAPGATRIDIGWRTVVPGFNDAHAH